MWQAPVALCMQFEQIDTVSNFDISNCFEPSRHSKNSVGTAYNRQCTLQQLGEKKTAA